MPIMQGIHYERVMPEDDDVTVRGRASSRMNVTANATIKVCCSLQLVGAGRTRSCRRAGASDLNAMTTASIGVVTRAVTFREEAEANMRAVGTTWNWQVT